MQINRTIAELEPTPLWNQFHQLTSIPRPSHHETAVQQYVMALGERSGLEVVRDEVGNVIVRKPATKGMEDRVGVILQGHLDMVPQANSGVEHDFARDPIKTVLEGDWVTAEDTTLGADNGIGVAAALAVLESKDIKHGPIEALFTANEEDGMGGAFGLKPGLLQGGMLINMDSEEEGVLSICCAGGANVNTRHTYRLESIDSGMKAFRLSVSGLKGGHSGVDIHRGRGNANKLLFRLLRTGADCFGLKITEIAGGNMRNAIPREAFAVVCLPEEAGEQFENFVSEAYAECLAELQQVEEGLKIECQPAPLPQQVMNWGSQQQLISAVCACPHGPLRMSDVMPGMVETSTNLAIVNVRQGRIEVFNLSRSMVDTALDETCLSIKGLFDLMGAQSTIDGKYPGWQPNVESAALKTVQEAYRHCFDDEVVVGGIHAGLECGILGATYPHWDMISFGPTISFPHSPDERVHIPSVGRFWQLLLRTLAEVPKRQS
ncbi:MAG: aminoacyl-histidine dipeptidase [Chromatiales bacterium]|nr:aminoacyl-histidine dipeptidase [Chromatiales bacterium]